MGEEELKKLLENADVMSGVLQECLSEEEIEELLLNKKLVEEANLTKEEFESRYQCYEFDLERAHGLKPWEDEYDRAKHTSKGDESIGEEGGAR